VKIAIFFVEILLAFRVQFYSIISNFGISSQKVEFKAYENEKTCYVSPVAYISIYRKTPSTGTNAWNTRTTYSMAGKDTSRF